MFVVAHCSLELESCKPYCGVMSGDARDSVQNGKTLSLSSDRMMNEQCTLSVFDSDGIGVGLHSRGSLLLETLSKAIKVSHSSRF